MISRMRCCCSVLAACADCATAPNNWPTAARRLRWAGSTPSAISSHGGVATFSAPSLPAVGQLEQLLAAFAFGADDQALVDQQLQGRVDRAGAGLPQVLAALGNLLDDLVAVHRSLGEQHQDGGTDITSTTAPALATAASAASARPEGTGAKSWAEARTEATGSESAAAAPAETGSERSVMPGVMSSDVVAEFAAGLLALFVEGAAVLGCETEARRPRFTCERPAHMGHACFKKWVVHGLISFLER